MVVVDASVVVDLLLGKGSQAGDELSLNLANGITICAPHLLDTEVGQVLRRYVLNGVIPASYAQMLIDELSLLPITRYPTLGLVSRALEMLHNVTVYDGTYLALAEVLGCTFLTGDGRLKEIPGCTAVVRVLSTNQP